MRAVVAYAAARHVTVVPEIEMPGHSAAALCAYPELGVSGQPVAVRTRWGVEQRVLNPTDHTVAFYQDVLAEVMDLFPSAYIHCGGDECPKDEWNASPAVRARMKELGLKDADALQSWFMGRMDTYLSAHGRHLIGWDEILEGGLSPGAAVMSWRGDKGAIAAAAQHHSAVNASSGWVYLDAYQSRDHAHEPHAIGGYLPLSKVYAFDPVPKGLPAEQQAFILGGQGQVWAEYIATPAHAEYMAYPRGCALAEALWSPAQGKDFAAFGDRLATHVQRLAAMGVNYRHLDPPSAADATPIGTWEPDQMRTDPHPLTWDATPAIAGPGRYRVTLQYTGGACRLNASWVALSTADGTEVARDTHDGTTGSRDDHNVYQLTVPPAPAGTRYRLTAEVRSDGGTDSAGTVTVVPAP